MCVVDPSQRSASVASGKLVKGMIHEYLLGRFSAASQSAIDTCKGSDPAAPSNSRRHESVDATCFSPDHIPDGVNRPRRVQ